MTIQYDTTLRNTMLDAIETRVGASATLEIRTLAQPANCAAADVGTVLATINLPTDMFTAAAAGAIALNGTWQDASADAAGTAAHFRIKQSGGTCIIQGSVSGPAGGGDIELSNASIEAGQEVNITQFNLTEGNP